MRRSNRSLWPSALLAALGLACASPPDVAAGPESVLAVGPEARMTPDGLHEVKGVSTGALFVKPNHQIGSYSFFIVEPVVLSYEQGGPRLTAEQEVRLNEYMRESTVRQIQTSGFELAEAPDPCAIRVDVELIDFAFPEGTGFVGSQTTIARSFGSVAIVLSLSDSVSGEPLLRYATRRSIPGGLYIDAGGLNWGRLKSLFDDFSRDLGEETARAAPAARGPVRADRCRDSIVPDRPPPGPAAAVSTSSGS